MARLFGRTPRQSRGQKASRLQAASREQTRRELVAMALRDVLKRHGLAAGCITAEGLADPADSRQDGVHIQLVYRDGQSNLLAYVLALEAAVKSRLERLDPLSPAWITGLSWRFEPKDRARWPQLPHMARSAFVPAAAMGRGGRSAAGALDALLRTGDAAFQHKVAAQLEFSPTLPMKAR